MSTKKRASEPTTYTFKTAPESRWLKPWGMTERQVRRHVAAGHIGYVRIGIKVQFSDDNLREFIASRTVTVDE